MNRNLILTLFVTGCVVLSNIAQADVAVLKAYKQAFPGTQNKCNACHVDNLPKKAQGQHEWNAYGLALKKALNAAGLPDVVTSDNVDQAAAVIKQTGKIEDFKPSK